MTTLPAPTCNDIRAAFDESVGRFERLGIDPAFEEAGLAYEELAEAFSDLAWDEPAPSLAIHAFYLGVLHGQRAAGAPPSA